MDGFVAMLIMVPLVLFLPFYELYTSITSDPLMFLAHVFIAIMAVVAAFFFLLAIILSGRKD